MGSGLPDILFQSEWNGFRGFNSNHRIPTSNNFIIVHDKIVSDKLLSDQSILEVKYNERDIFYSGLKYI